MTKIELDSILSVDSTGIRTPTENAQDEYGGDDAELGLFATEIAILRQSVMANRREKTSMPRVSGRPVSPGESGAPFE